MCKYTNDGWCRGNSLAFIRQNIIVEALYNYAEATECRKILEFRNSEIASAGFLGTIKQTLVGFARPVLPPLGSWCICSVMNVL